MLTTSRPSRPPRNGADSAENHVFRLNRLLAGLPHIVLDGDLYKRPRYASQPPELGAWLERKSVTAMHTSSDRSQLFAGNLAETLADTFTRLAPVYRFLCTGHAEAMQTHFRQDSPVLPLTEAISGPDTVPTAPPHDPKGKNNRHSASILRFVKSASILPLSEKGA